ncbi:MAG: hypothetical protein M1829_002852 [Trizodia sp. TS-e1964]|nr:MAG: hypothetical protein M1829_002852 [Trizodia sp. TS-e1964]
MPAAAATSGARKSGLAPERKYSCQYCNHSFSRSEHRSRHERSHTKERPFKCMKCRSTFVRRDLLLRHDRTVHAKDGGIPLHSEVKRRPGAKSGMPRTSSRPAKSAPLAIDTATLEQIEASSDGLVDMETAAMLITDIQHKATAAMSSQHAHARPDAADSPSGTTLIEPSFAFPSVTMSIAHETWDSFMPHAAHEPKARSISSSVSGSQDSQSSQISLTSVSTLQPQAQPLPPLMDRQPSACDALAPALHSFSNSCVATPGAYSPFPYLAGPASPSELRRSPGPSGQPLMQIKPPQLESDDERNAILDRIRDTDKERVMADSLRLPGKIALNRYLSTYFNLFHPHLPFLHPPSFNPAHVSPPLLLAILSIGALYTFEQEQAYMLHIGSKVMVSQFLQNKENFSSRKCPLWAMQSSLLNMIFASWSGDPKGLEWACSIKSLLANMVSGNIYQLRLRTDARDGRTPTHEEWVEDESCARTYFAVYIFFGMLTLTYNHTPAINFDELDSLDLPSSETRWNLDPPDAENRPETTASTQITTLREAHDSLIQGKAAVYSSFATRIMINALFLEVWFHKRSPDALQDVVTGHKLRLALETWEKSLEVCVTEGLVVPLITPHKGHPLIFNAKAMYRNTKARLEVDLKSIQEALRYHDSYEVAAAMSHARDLVKRSEEMTKVIQDCFDCISIAALQGIRWVARTSATNWSVEHPLCGLDLMVILSLWLYRLEHDEEPATEDELAMYNKVRTLFDDDSMDVYGSKLSSTVARLWGSLLDEVVVWGITKLMGESFKLHYQALIGYEDAVSCSSGASTPAMSVLGATDSDMEDLIEF